MIRDQHILTLRQSIPSAKPNDFSSIETFQNTTLRPILKLQHVLIIATIENTPHFKTAQKNIEKAEDKLPLIKEYISNNKELKSTLIGLCIGLMTFDEYTGYSLHKKEFTKRISQMCAQRYFDTKYNL